MVSDSLGQAIFIGYVIYTFFPAFLFTLGITYLVIRWRTKLTLKSFGRKHLLILLIVPFLIACLTTTAFIQVTILMDRNEVRSASFYPCKWLLCIGNIIQPYSTAESKAALAKLDFTVYQAKEIDLSYGPVHQKNTIVYSELSEGEISHAIIAKMGYGVEDSGFTITERKFYPELVMNLGSPITYEETQVWLGGGSVFIKKEDTIIKVDGFESGTKGKISDNMATLIKALVPTEPINIILKSRSPEAIRKEKDQEQRNYRQQQE